MNKKLKNIALAFFAITILSGCCNVEERFLNEQAALVSGVNFDTAKLVVVDPETSQTVKPCMPKIANRSGYVSNSNEKENQEAVTILNGQACTIEIPNGEINQSVKSALELSKKPIQGKILNNGKLVDARFVVTVITLYEGSKCNVYNSGGAQYQKCIRGGH